MRFRGKLEDVKCVKEWSNIIATVAKLSPKSCVLRLCPDKVYFVLSEDMSLPGHIQSWCSLESTHLFSEYTMEGVSNTHNEIVLKLCPDMMSKSLNLKQNSSAKCVKIKLTNKKQPCLTFEIELHTQSSLPRLCVHDVPVMLVPRVEWPMYQNTTLPKPDMSVQLSHIKCMRNVLQRMKKLSSKLEVCASTAGELKLSIESHKVSVTTFFKELVDCGPDDNTEVQEVSLWIDIRRLVQFIVASDLLNPDQAICHLLKERLMYLNYSSESWNFHLFIPAIFL